MISAIYPYLTLLISHFVVLFSPSLSLSSCHEEHSTIYNVFYDQPVIFGRKEILLSPLPKKKVRVNYNQTNALILSWNKVWVFFFLLVKFLSFSFWSASCSRHILMNIFNMNFYNYFETKRSLNNTPYRKFSLNCKPDSKTRKKINLKKELSLN